MYILAEKKRNTPKMTVELNQVQAFRWTSFFVAIHIIQVLCEHENSRSDLKYACQSHWTAIYRCVERRNVDFVGKMDFDIEFILIVSSNDSVGNWFFFLMRRPLVINYTKSVHMLFPKNLQRNYRFVLECPNCVSTQFFFRRRRTKNERFQWENFDYWG